MPEPRSNRIMNPVAFVFVIVSALVVSYAVGFMPKAHADTGAPSIGNFVAGTASCEVHRQGTPSIEFRGTLDTLSQTVLGVVSVPDKNRTSMLTHKGVATVWVDGQIINPTISLASLTVLNPGFYYQLPGWDGIGEKPTVVVRVSSPVPSDEIRFSLAWAADSPRQVSNWYTLLAAGKVAIGCEETSNPSQPYIYNYIPVE